MLLRILLTLLSLLTPTIFLHQHYRIYLLHHSATADATWYSSYSLYSCYLEFCLLYSVYLPHLYSCTNIIASTYCTHAATACCYRYSSYSLHSCYLESCLLYSVYLRHPYSYTNIIASTYFITLLQLMPLVQ